MTEFASVLDFWLGDAARSPAHAETQKKLWYRSSTSIDLQIHEQFSEIHRQACNGELEAWRAQPESCLALVIVLDQFSRHLHRATPGAFAQDDLALEIARNCPQPNSLPLIGRVFLLHPFEHSEHINVQKESSLHFKQLVEEADEDWQPMMENFYEHALEHQAIVLEYGRFPHRNDILGRVSTPEELEFLKSSGKTFGQKKT